MDTMVLRRLNQETLRNSEAREGIMENRCGHFYEFESVIVEYGNTKFEGIIFSHMQEMGYYAVMVKHIIHTDDEWLLETSLVTIAEKYLTKLPRNSDRNDRRYSGK